MRQSSSHLTYLLSLMATLQIVAPIAFAQTSSRTTTQMKTQKYNGYGLPNTKFKKVKIDLAKKKNAPNAEPSIAAPVITMPKTPIQADGTTATTGPTAAAPAKFLTFGFAYDVSYNAQAQLQEKNAREEYILDEFTPKMVIGEYTLLGVFDYIENVKNPGASEWADSSVFLSKKAWELGRVITLSPHALLILPLSKASREVVQMKYGLSAGFTLGLNTKNLGAEKLGLNYVLRYTKYTNEFDTKTNNEPVNDHQIRQRINLSYSFTEKFSFRTRFEYNSNYSAQNVVKNGYVHFEIFNYQFTENFSANIGHSAGGSVYTIRDSDAGSSAYLENDLKFYDPKTSELAVGLGFSI